MTNVYNHKKRSAIISRPLIGGVGEVEGKTFASLLFLSEKGSERTRLPCLQGYGFHLEKE